MCFKKHLCCRFSTIEYMVRGWLYDLYLCRRFSTVDSVTSAWTYEFRVYSCDHGLMKSRENCKPLLWIGQLWSWHHCLLLLAAYPFVFAEVWDFSPYAIKLWGFEWYNQRVIQKMKCQWNLAIWPVTWTRYWIPTYWIVKIIFLDDQCTLCHWNACSWGILYYCYLNISYNFFTSTCCYG